MPEFGNIVLAMTERDRIQRSFRRLAARQTLETILGQHLVDGANPIRPLRMAGRRDVLEEDRMRVEPCRHAPI